MSIADPHHARRWRARVARRLRAGALPFVALSLGSAGVLALQPALGASRPDAPANGYRWQLPAGFPMPRVPANNPMSTAKAEIGRHLFYDDRLSGNGTQSCSSCHQQDLAFTDGRTTPVGSTGATLPRNALSLANVAYEKTLTWANPALVTLEQQMAVPLFGTTPVEMGVTDANAPHVLARLRHDPWYARHFRTAFPGHRQPLTFITVIRAIAAFQRTLISADSRYDRYLHGTGTLTASEARGLRLFQSEDAGCHHCHGNFLFNDSATYVGAADEPAAFHNDGLYNLGGTGAYPSGNRGIFEVTGRPQDMGRFRAPSLRNVALTAPYMHDGSIATLAEVVDHYARGGRFITDGPYAGDGKLSPYKDPNVAGIDLTARDKADLVAFLRSLTDHRLTTSPRFADPFHHKETR